MNKDDKHIHHNSAQLLGFNAKQEQRKSSLTIEEESILDLSNKKSEIYKLPKFTHTTNLQPCSSFTMQKNQIEEADNSFNDDRISSHSPFTMPPEYNFQPLADLKIKKKCEFMDTYPVINSLSIPHQALPVETSIPVTSGASSILPSLLEDTHCTTIKCRPALTNTLTHTFIAEERQSKSPEMKKTTRPFKAYPKDPLSLVMSTNFVSNRSLDDDYTEFRKRMLDSVRRVTDGTNNKMRRVAKCPGSPTSTMDEKDAAYWERRRKNNEAAKRSRDARRAKEDEIAIRAAFLEQENVKLKYEIMSLKNETIKLRYIMYHN